MSIDTLFQVVDAKEDTLKETGFLVGNMPESQIIPDFNLEKTLITAFIGALIAQVLIILVTFVKTELGLRTKKKLLITDLKNHKTILIKLKAAYVELLTKFENKNTNRHTVDSFKELQLDVFNSITKTDLYKIFGEDIHEIVKIYKTIEFLKEFSVDRIYTDYITKLSNHLHEKKGIANHEYYCATHLSLIDFAESQLKSNIKTVNELLIEIEVYIK